MSRSRKPGSNGPRRKCADPCCWICGGLPHADAKRLASAEDEADPAKRDDVHPAERWWDDPWYDCHCGRCPQCDPARLEPDPEPLRVPLLEAARLA